MRISTLTPVASRTNLLEKNNIVVNPVHEDKDQLLDIFDHSQTHAHAVRGVIGSTDR